MVKILTEITFKLSMILLSAQIYFLPELTPYLGENRLPFPNQLFCGNFCHLSAMLTGIWR